jgi:hypothetical protein
MPSTLNQCTHSLMEWPILPPLHGIRIRRSKCRLISFDPHIHSRTAKTRLGTATSNRRMVWPPPMQPTEENTGIVETIRHGCLHLLHPTATMIPRCMSVSIIFSPSRLAHPLWFPSAIRELRPDRIHARTSSSSRAGACHGRSPVLSNPAPSRYVPVCRSSTRNGPPRATRAIQRTQADTDAGEASKLVGGEFRC